LIADTLPKSSLPEFIIIPPQQNAYQEQDSEAEEEGEELCEEPKALQTFHAANPQIAREKAAAKNLLILYAGRERWDLFGRSHIYYGLPPAFVLRLLRLETDMKAEDEFTDEEKPILHDMLLKKWIKKMRSNGKNYYYGLNRKTAVILQKQLSKSNNLY
jgi:hypothetical protein